MNDANGIRPTAATQLSPSDASRAVRLEIAVKADFISFRGESEFQRIDVLGIRGISVMETAATLRVIPRFSGASLNLRGVRVPVVDLRKRNDASEGSCECREADIVVIDSDGVSVGAVIDARSNLANLIPSLQPSELMRKLVGDDVLVHDANAAPHLMVFMDVVPHEG